MSATSAWCAQRGWSFSDRSSRILSISSPCCAAAPRTSVTWGTNDLSSKGTSCSLSSAAILACSPRSPDSSATPRHITEDRRCEKDPRSPRVSETGPAASAAAAPASLAASSVLASHMPRKASVRWRFYLSAGVPRLILAAAAQAIPSSSSLSASVKRSARKRRRGAPCSSSIMPPRPPYAASADVSVPDVVQDTLTA